MKLGIDIDGVLADFVGGVRKIGEPLGWEIDDSNWGLGLTKKQESQLWALVDADPNFWFNLKPLRGPVSWPEDSIVYFITKRRAPVHGHVELQAAAWLSAHMDEDYPFVISSSKKGEVCKALDIDAFIDDKPENCWDVKDNSPATKVFIFDQPWNKWEERTGGRSSRVSTLEEFLEQAG